MSQNTHSRPESPSRPADYTLEIPDVFSSCFLIPLKPLGSWDAKKGAWADKTPAGSAMAWQKRDEGFRIPPNATGYGIPAGKNGLFFLDIDAKKEDEDGEVNLRALFEEYGDGDWFDTYEFRTGSGARQLCFTITPELAAVLKPTKGSNANGLTLGVDTRVNDSYSVGPGSLVVQDATNEIGRYEELTPGRSIAALESYPWLVEVLKKSATKEWKNPTHPKHQKAAASSSASSKLPVEAVADAPVLRAQKRENALFPVVGWLMKEIEDGKGRHPTLFAAGTKAGTRQVELEDFIKTAMEVLTVASQDTDSKFHAYDLAHAETQLRAGWKDGHKDAESKSGLENEFSAYELTKAFIVAHPEYRWVVPKEDQREAAGMWLKFETDGRSRDVGIYKPLDQTVIRVELFDWLTSMIDAASVAGEADRESYARKARDGYTVDEVLRQMKGRESVRAFLEDFDRDTHRVVDGSGIRDLNTGEALPYSPDFLATRKIYFPGDEANYEAHADDVERIMSSCHEEDRPFLEAMLGTVLRQEQPLSKKGVIIYGPKKDNGKTTLMEALLAVLGEGEANSFGLKSNHAIAHRQSDNKYAEADLDAKTLTLLDDFAANREVDNEKLKQYIGSGQSYKARQIGQRTRTIRLVHTFFLTCNRLPNFGRGEDVIDRFEIVLFPYKYPSDDQLDPNNEWHRPRDPYFTAEVGNNRKLQDAFYCYLLRLHRAWADSGSRVETDTINDHIRANKEDWKGKTNTLHALLSEHAAPSADHFVSEADLIAFITHMLREQGQGVFGTQALRTELEGLLLLRQWNVEHCAKKPRSRNARLKALQQSRWMDPISNVLHPPAPDSANIFAGLRLKTNANGRLLTEDEWTQVQADLALVEEAAATGEDEESLRNAAQVAAMEQARATLAAAGISPDQFYATSPITVTDTDQAREELQADLDSFVTGLDAEDTDIDTYDFDF